MSKSGGKKKLMPRGRPFRKGEHVTGRAKGTPNKFTTLKQAFVNAFEATGGENGLTAWATSSKGARTEFYKLLGKMLPRDVQVQVDGTLTLSEKIRNARARVTGSARS